MTARLFPRFSLLVALLLLLTTASVSYAQVAAVPQIAKVNATRSNSTFLLGFYPTASKTQSLYLPADLTGATAGDIERLYFMYGTTGNATGTTLSNLTIKLGQTTSTTFSGTSFFSDQNFKTVLRAPSYVIAPGASGDWFSIALDSTFTYDPTQTLVLQINFTGSTTTTFGTAGSTNNGKKMYADTPTATTGSTSSSTWQHFGFDLAGTPTGVAPAVATLALGCFPNPAHDVLTVRYPATGATPATLTLTDALGRTVRHLTVAAAALRTGAPLPVADVPAGAYVLTVLHKGQRLSQRVSVR